MTPIPFDKLGIPEEILRQCPPSTPAQGAARRKADLEMDEKYAGNHVAYIDTWTGDALERTIIAVASEVAEFHKALAKLPPDVRKRVQCTYLSPADFIDVPSVWLVE